LSFSALAASLHPGTAAGRRRKPGSSYRRSNVVCAQIVAASIAIFLAAANAGAQRVVAALSADRDLIPALDLPSAPDPTDPQPALQRSSGSLVGTVFDSNGDVLQGARVALTGRSRPVDLIVESGSNGEFSFNGLQPGTYRITVSGAGMGTYISPDLPLGSGEVRFVSQIVLPYIGATTEVRVTGDREELAEEQVHIAIDQRVLGVLPNFYTTFDWNAPPMGPKQKFQLAFRSVTDPVAFFGAGALAGVQQANNTYPGFGQEGMGFMKRFGAAYANDASGRMLSSAIFPSLFHQDPRYFYRGKGSKVSRAFYAISAAVITRADNGNWQPNYSHVLGNFAAGGLSNLYYPAANRGFSLTLVNGLIETAGNAGNNLLREFVLKGFTSRGSGQP